MPIATCFRWLRDYGTSPDGRLVEIIELPNHPFSLLHNSIQSFNPQRPPSLFKGFVQAVMARSDQGQVRVSQGRKKFRCRVDAVHD